VSILNQVGLPELIGTSVDEYVRLAAELAGNRDRLGELRGSLRDRMKGSPLMDEKRFAADFEGVYRVMWKKWCAGK
jgi:protein O-GlcNAc transferase